MPVVDDVSKSARVVVKAVRCRAPSAIGRETGAILASFARQSVARGRGRALGPFGGTTSIGIVETRRCP